MSLEPRPDQAFYESLIDSSPLVVFRLTGHPVTVTYVSDNSTRVFGWAPEDVASPGWGWAEVMHPDDAERAQPQPGEATSSVAQPNTRLELSLT